MWFNTNHIIGETYWSLACERMCVWERIQIWLKVTMIADYDFTSLPTHLTANNTGTTTWMSRATLGVVNSSRAVYARAPATPAAPEMIVGYELLYVHHMTWRISQFTHIIATLNTPDTCRIFRFVHEHTHARMHARTHARTHTHTPHTHAHTRTHTHTTHLSQKTKLI